MNRKLIKNQYCTHIYDLLLYKWVFELLFI